MNSNFHSCNQQKMGKICNLSPTSSFHNHLLPRRERCRFQLRTLLSHKNCPVLQ
jgi:hypothetical protein